MSRVASASPSVPRRHGAPVAHALAHPNSAQAASSAGACRYGAAGSWGVTGPGRMSWLPRCSVVGFGPELLLGGRGGAGTILTMAATVIAGILALRLAAPTSRMASSRDSLPGFRAEPQFFSSSPGRSSAEPIWAPSLQCRHPQTRLRKTQEFYCCQLLHDGMFRAAPHQNDARHVSGRR